VSQTDLPLTPQCVETIQKSLSVIISSCFVGSESDQIKTNALSVVENTKLCSIECNAAAEAFSGDLISQCGNGYTSRGISIANFSQTLMATKKVLCTTNSEGDYCYSTVVYPAMVAKGYNVSDIRTFLKSTHAFSKDPVTACNQCITNILKELKKNLAYFPRDHPLQNVNFGVIENTCAQNGYTREALSKFKWLKVSRVVLDVTLYSIVF
jgi:hypothetical protein